LPAKPVNNFVCKIPDKIITGIKAAINNVIAHELTNAKIIPIPRLAKFVKIFLFKNDYKLKKRTCKHN
jgi:hypothetical protein